MKEFGATDSDPGKIRLTVTWKTPRTSGTTITILGVTDCLSQPARLPANGSGPCLIKGTPLPARSERVIASVAAARGSASWTWPAWGDVGGAFAADSTNLYYAVVVGASNGAGQSKFTIAGSGEWCSDCVY